jgi:outer membrane protein assembly factor BamA
MRKILIFWGFILLLCNASVFANNFTLQIIIEESEAEAFKKIKYKKQHNSLGELQQEMQKMLLSFYDKGYLTASFDSIAETENSVTAYLTMGNQYEWLLLSPGNADKQLMGSASYKEKFYSNTPFNYKEVSGLCNKILNELENNGYPFAVVRLDSIVVENEKISAALYVEKNQVFRYDTITLNGDSKISKYYLYNYLGIKAGSLYNESNAKKIDNRLRQLSFLTIEKPTEIIFSGDEAKPIFNLGSKKSSQFDFLVGFLPNNDVTGKLLITGEANVNLLSPFGFGENLRLNWRKLQPRTQNLDAGFSFPYIVSLPFGVDAGIRLYKRDTLFLDVDWDAGLSYLFVGGNYFKAFVNGRFSNIITVDTNEIIVNRNLPEYLDTRRILYGLEYYFEKLNYRFNPTKGYIIKLRGGAGNRRIIPNNTIANIQDPENSGQTFAWLYDSIPNKSIQYKLDYRLEKYWQLTARNTIKTGLVGGTIISDEVFINEMYRIGGTKHLRGFDEESIFASMFHLATLEYRFLLDQNSYFNIFGDVAYTESKTNREYRNDFPYGFGAGIAFATKAGIFSVTYALGSQQGTGINFRAAKIHFGYVNLF